MMLTLDGLNLSMSGPSRSVRAHKISERLGTCVGVGVEGYLVDDGSYERAILISWCLYDSKCK